MSERTTMRQLQGALQVLARTWNVKDIGLDFAYGSVRLTADNGSRDISHRMTKGQMYSLLHALVNFETVVRPRSGLSANPIKGPGKFEGETYAARYAYENVDQSIGSVDELGWYGVFTGKIKGRGPFHIIDKALTA